jgi:predicted RNase H-like nuclease
MVELVSRADADADADGEMAVIAIDIPIGLADAGPRAADIQAARLLGARRSSVFQTPVRPALEAEDHASAAGISRRLTGAGVSIQAFSLKAKIFEVDAWVRGTDRRVVEVHPELSLPVWQGPRCPTAKSRGPGASIAAPCSPPRAFG